MLDRAMLRCRFGTCQPPRAADVGGMIRALLLCLLLVVPAAAQEAPPDPAAPTGPIAVGTDAAADAAIEARIEGIAAQLDGYEAVGVTVREGVVTLTGSALEADAVDRLEALVARVEGVVAIQNEVAANTDVADRIDPLLDRTGDRVAQTLAYLPLLAIALVVGTLVAGLGWALARWERPWRRLAPNGFIAQIYRTVLRLAFTVLGIVVALDILGATAVLGTFLGAAGIVGLALGFAVRDTVENFIASVMLSLRQPFRPGDFVEIEGDKGTVVRLNSRATILLDPDGNHLRLSNATVFNARILNYTRNAERRFGFTLGIDPGDDVAEARRIGVEVLRGLDFTLDEPPPQAWIRDVGASTVDVDFFAWLDQTQADFLVARSEAIRLVMAALTKADIGLPEPTYRLNLLGGALPVVDLPDTKDRPEALVMSEGEPEPRPAAAPEPVVPVRSVAAMAEAERRRERDLLSEAAPHE